MKTNSELLALIANLEILARGFHLGANPSRNIDDETRREKILAEARDVIRASGIEIATRRGTVNAGKPFAMWK